MALIPFSGSSNLRVAAFALVLLALATGAAEAQRQRVGIHVGTAILAGEFEDLQGDTVYLRVSLHDQRRIPLGNVFMMDFTDERLAPTPEEVAEANDGQTGRALRWHLLVLRSGERIKGRLLAIEGGPGSARSQDLRIVTFGGADAHIRQYEATDVARIYMRVIQLRGTAPSQPAPGPTRDAGIVTGLPLGGDVRWVSTALMVRQGEPVEFKVNGEVHLSRDPNDVAGPAGSLLGERSSRATMPDELLGALIGRIGSGEPFGIGNQTRIVMPESGELFLGVNDDNHADNTGRFTVVITRQPQ